MGKNATFRAGIYARVSTLEQKTLPMQLGKMKKYVKDRGWMVSIQVEDIGSGAKDRPKRDEIPDLLTYARREMSG